MRRISKFSRCGALILLLAGGFQSTIRAEDVVSDADLLAMSGFSFPLTPSGATEPVKNFAFSQAVKGWLARESQDDFSALENFAAGHPDSPWVLVALLNVADAAYQAGWFSKSLENYGAAWELGKSASGDQARLLADRAAAGKIGMLARVGRIEELNNFLAEVGDRIFSGASAELVAQAKSGLAEMNNLPGKSFKCGPMALSNVQQSRGSISEQFAKAIFEIQSLQKGFNLYELLEMANALGMNMRIAFRSPGSSVIIPSVVNWKLAHYGALTARDNGKFHLEDPTFVSDFWITSQALDEQSSGYFLVPEGDLPSGWRSVDKEEAENVWGKGNTTQSDTGAIGPENNVQCPPCPSIVGMPAATVDALLVSLSIGDTPLVYQPAIGPGGKFSVLYSQRSVAMPANAAFSNLGPQWKPMWLSFVTYNPNSAAASVSVYTQGGGTISFSGFTSSQNTSSPDWPSSTRLVRSGSTGNITFERINIDGSKEVYGQDDGTVVTGGTTSKRVFLSQVVDAQGNALTLSYDSLKRISQLTDATGQVTTLSYELPTTTIPANAYKITKVTDPIGRTAVFTYADDGKLFGITDALGLTSTFSYASGSTFINAMTTPYGTTKFVFQDVPGTTNRWLETTDPMGDTERVEYRTASTSVSVPASEVPNVSSSVMKIFNQWMTARTTYYWDKKAYKEANGDLTKARIYHWLHTSNTNVTDRVLESIKEPFSSRVWFNYVGTETQSAAPGAIAGTMALPTRIARVVDGPDGTTQVTQLIKNAYNTQGNLTETIDPLGRRTIMTYATNGIDLIKVEQEVSGSLKQVFAATYNGAHLPLTVTDAAGQVTTATYNSKGQPLTITNAKNEVSTFTYYSADLLDGSTLVGQRKDRLASVDGPLSGSGDTTILDYDAAGRLKTFSDPEGYVLTYAYDALNRLTQVTYPDSTTELWTYSVANLNLDSTTDRLGRTTSYTYNAIQQLVGVRDALNRQTVFDWCKCGAMKSLIDAMGRTTRWQHDVQSRLVGKTYADGTKITFAYDRSSRLSTTKDAFDQIRTTRYNIDDTPATISYSGAIHATPSVSMTWDAAFKRLTSVTDGTGTTSYAYNTITGTATLGAGRLASVDGPLADDTVSYTYDALGRVLTKSIDSIASSVSYDTAGRITQAINALGQFDYTYDGVTSRLATAIAPNGLETVMSYLGNTGDHRLETLTYTGPSSSTISSFDYVTNAGGEITQWTQNQGSTAVWALHQDAANQLIRVDVSGSSSMVETFSYDKAGNRTQTQTGANFRTGTFNTLNQLTSLSDGGKMKVSGTTDEPSTVTVQGQSAWMTSATNFTTWANVTAGTNTIPIVATDGNGNSKTNFYQVVVPSGGVSRGFTYDAVGNTLTDGLREIEWDANNQMVKITLGGDVYEWAYNAFGERVSEKKNGTIVKHWVWAGGSQPVQERDASNNVTKQFFSQGEKRGSTSYYYSRDHLGSIRDATDASGTVVANYTYDSWGNQFLLSGADLATFGYTGHLQQNEVGLILAKYRAYDSETGRWLSRDPIGEKGGINLYGYVSNNPINATDPLGLDAYLAFAPGHALSLVDTPAGNVAAFNYRYENFGGYTGDSIRDLRENWSGPGDATVEVKPRLEDFSLSGYEVYRVPQSPEQDLETFKRMLEKANADPNYSLPSSTCVSQSVDTVFPAAERAKSLYLVHGLGSGDLMWPMDMAARMRFLFGPPMSVGKPGK